MDWPPEAPPDRRDRQAVPGAALWELTDFATHTDAPGRDLLEAALADAGLLDAWVTPDGTLTLPDGQVDRIVAVGRPAPSTSLANALTAVDHDAVPADVTRAVLTGVELMPSALPGHPDRAEHAAGGHGREPERRSIRRHPAAMSGAQHERAATILGDPYLSPLIDELAQRLSASDRPVVRVTLRDLDQQARVALADLLRLDHTPPATVQIDVRRLAKMLHIEALDVVAVVERIRGPLGNRARARATVATARAAAADRLADAAMAVDHRLCDWARRQAIAVDGDLDAQVTTVEAALRVLAAASKAQPEPLPVVACRVLGDPHAADADRNVGRVLRSALAMLGLGGSVREHMLKVGIADDEVSSTVATWALPFPTDHPAAGWYEAGEMVVMTIGQLRRHPIERVPRFVTVVENPSVLAVARTRERDMALLCLSGQPSHAALLACDQIVAAGGRLALHTDFDIAGLGIIDQLKSRYEHRAAAWRMDADDYRRAVAGSTVELDPTHVPNTPWSPPLADAMRTHARAAFEEAMIDTLLAETQR